MLLALPRPASTPSTEPSPRRPRRHIRVETVKGDELFDAVVFLGHALDLPALLPVDADGFDDGEVTGEYAVVLPFRRP